MHTLVVELDRVVWGVVHEAHLNQLSCCFLARQCLVHSQAHDIITHILRHILIGLAGQETASTLKRQLRFGAKLVPKQPMGLPRKAPRSQLRSRKMRGTGWSR